MLVGGGLWFFVWLLRGFFVLPPIFSPSVQFIGMCVFCVLVRVMRGLMCSLADGRTRALGETVQKTRRPPSQGYDPCRRPESTPPKHYPRPQHQHQSNCQHELSSGGARRICVGSGTTCGSAGTGRTDGGDDGCTAIGGTGVICFCG